MSGDGNNSQSVPNINTESSWIRSAISNPVVGDIRRAIQERGNPLRLPFLSQRQNSCPTSGSEAMVTHRADSHRSQVNSTASTSNGGATVIQMEGFSDHLPDAPATTRNRNRRSSISGPGTADDTRNDQERGGIGHELGTFAARLWRNTHVRVNPRLLNYESATHTLPSTNNSIGVSITQTASNVGESENDSAGGANSDEEGNNEGEDAAPNVDIPNLRALLRNREAIAQFFYQNYAEFPNLHGLNVLVTGAIVAILLLVHFLIQNFGSCFSLVLAFFHYQDSSRFVRCISGSGDIYLPLANILIRNFIILYVLDKGFILSAATFHDEITSLEHSSFFSTLYRVIVTELFIMDVALLCKLLISKIPNVSKSRKRRAYQWIEYTSTLYRFPIPFVQWTAYFNGIVGTVIYSLVKVLNGLSIVWTWFRTTVRLFRYSHLGSQPTHDEMKHAEHCTICYGDFSSPIKLNCNHIFCSDCIRTWLDREVTCPICRATVTKEDNNYRNGNSIFPIHIF